MKPPIGTNVRRVPLLAAKLTRVIEGEANTGQTARRRDLGDESGHVHEVRSAGSPPARPAYAIWLARSRARSPSSRPATAGSPSTAGSGLWRISRREWRSRRTRACCGAMSVAEGAQERISSDAANARQTNAVSPHGPCHPLPTLRPCPVRSGRHSAAPAGAYYHYSVRVCSAEVRGSTPLRSTSSHHAHEQAFLHPSGRVVNPPKWPRASIRLKNGSSR